MPDSSAKPFVLCRRPTPGALQIARKLGVQSLGDLSRLDEHDLESLRSCASGARCLVDRFPTAANFDLTVFEDKS